MKHFTLALLAITFMVVSFRFLSGNMATGNAIAMTIFCVIYSLKVGFSGRRNNLK